MNFFDAQDKAKRATRWLVIVYIISTILIVTGVTLVIAGSLLAMSEGEASFPPEFYIGIAVVTAMFIIGATLYKTSRLSAGGSRVALDMGGTVVTPDVRDPLRRRLRNVVEEMAIASGVPVPEIFVLEEEQGINAFAAGFAPGDAAITVTRGCLEVLTRDELQGVIAHEFSHVLNGDMRLNIRMMGVLFGIMFVGMIGRMIVHSQHRASLFSTSRNKSAGGVILLGFGLTLLGAIGVLMSRLIKAAVSRQREYLADASAVQFTRQTDGIGNALKKIGGFAPHSYITRADPEEVSHMLFANGSSRLISLFATHPPLEKRIQALDPSFTSEQYPHIDLKNAQVAQENNQASGFAPDHSSSRVVDLPTGSKIIDAVGNPDPRHIQFAQKIRSTIPEELYEASHTPEQAWLVALALAVSSDPSHSDKQLSLLDEQIGSQRNDFVRRYHAEIVEIGPQYRLPLLEIAFPIIRNRPEQQIEFLIDLVAKLNEVDGRLDLGEFCFYTILRNQLIEAVSPAAAARGNRVSKKAAQKAAVELILLTAKIGNRDSQQQRHAFAIGIKPFGPWAEKYPADFDQEISTSALASDLEILGGMNTDGRKSMLIAARDTIAADGKVTISEAELLRAIAASLHCPLPPMT